LPGPSPRLAATLAFAILVAGGVPSWAAPRAPSPTVELLTVGPGDELYARFGHAALLVRWPGRGAWTYNYGYTDFDQPNLVMRFLRGQAVFFSVAQRLEGTLEIYLLEDRTVFTQRLALEGPALDELVLGLERDARPGAPGYVYHHFNDNCATRLRDLVDRAASGALARATRGRPTGLTLRDVVREGFAEQLGVLLLADLLIGRRVDVLCDEWRGSFLPRILSAALTRARLPSGRPLVDPPVFLYTRHGPDPLRHDPLAAEKLLGLGALAFALLGVAAVLLARRGSRRLAGLALAPMALVLGAAGALVAGLASVSSLPEFRENELLLVLWPTDLILAVGIVIRSVRHAARPPGRTLVLYAAARLGVGLAALLGHAAGVLVQRPRVFILLELVFAAALVATVVVPRRRASPEAPPPEPLTDTPPHLPGQAT
jgi:hypothetical protein